MYPKVEGAAGRGRQLGFEGQCPRLRQYQAPGVSSRIGIGLRGGTGGCTGLAGGYHRTLQVGHDAIGGAVHAAQRRITDRDEAGCSVAPLRLSTASTALLPGLLL